MASPPAAAAPARTAVHLVFSLLCASACFQAADSAPRFRPTISSSLQVKPSLGQSLVVPCEGYSTYPKDGIIYWLANTTFVDILYPDGSVIEGETEEKQEGNLLFLTRKLTFQAFSEKDRDTTFQCIIFDPSGPTQKTITWESKKSQSKRTVQDTADSGSGLSEGC